MMVFIVGTMIPHAKIEYNEIYRTTTFIYFNKHITLTLIHIMIFIALCFCFVIVFNIICFANKTHEPSMLPTESPYLEYQDVADDDDIPSVPCPCGILKEINE